MGWNKPLEAAANDKGAVRISVQVSSKGRSRLVVLLSEIVMEELGLPDSANAWLGDGEDSGKILLQFDKDGTIPVKRWSKGGASLRFVLPVDLAQTKQRALVCQHDVMEADDVKQLVVVIPPAIVTAKRAA